MVAGALPHRAHPDHTSLDHRLSRSMEPRAATPKRRLDAVRQLTAAGVPTTVVFAPSIPSLNCVQKHAPSALSR